MRSLTICIATIPERKQQYSELCAEFARQIASTSCPVLILTDPEPRGALSIGAKRQRMLHQVSTDYAVFFDDDDWPGPTYVKDISQAIQGFPDCVGFYELVEGLDSTPRIAIWSNRFTGWMEGARAKPHGVDYVRTPFHKTPIRTDIAQRIGFQDLRFAEDADFSRRLKASGLCRTEVFIPKTLYIYRYAREDHKTKFGI